MQSICETRKISGNSMWVYTMQQDPDKREARFLRGCLSGISSETLEIGCGDGRLTTVIAEISENLTAADPSIQALQAARRHVGQSVEFLVGSGESLPFSAGTFDTVIFTLSLHHQDACKALKEAGRVSRDSGHTLILEPISDTLIGKLFSVLEDESWKYEIAKCAIETSRFEVIHAGAIKYRWVFADFQEITTYLFDYFSMKPDQKKIDIMADLLGESKGSKPISIEDIANYWLLQKI